MLKSRGGAGHVERTGRKECTYVVAGKSIEKESTRETETLWAHNIKMGYGGTRCGGVD
jgi:hypothetical protein